MARMVVLHSLIVHKTQKKIFVPNFRVAHFDGGKRFFINLQKLSFDLARTNLAGKHSVYSGKI